MLPQILFHGHQTLIIYGRLLRDSTPHFVGPSVRRSVHWSVRHTLLFFGFCGLGPHCSCSNDQLTSNTAPAPARDWCSRVSGPVSQLVVMRFNDSILIRLVPGLLLFFHQFPVFLSGSNWIFYIPKKLLALMICPQCSYVMLLTLSLSRLPISLTYL